MKEEGVKHGHGAGEWLDTRGSVITPIITPWVSLDQLDSVAEGVFDEAIRHDEARAFLKDPSHIMMLAMEDEMVVGMASGVVIRHPDKLRELWINEVGVADRARGNGLAQRLVQGLFEWSVARDIHTAWLLMDRDNKAAAKSYAKVEPAARSAPAVMLEWSL